MWNDPLVMLCQGILVCELLADIFLNSCRGFVVHLGEEMMAIVVLYKLKYFIFCCQKHGGNGKSIGKTQGILSCSERGNPVFVFNSFGKRMKEPAYWQ